MSGWLGARHVHVEQAGSTNDEAAELARDGAAHGTIITAEEQTAGRGRGDHSWHSPPGQNLYLSVVLRPPLEPRHVPPITLAAGVGVCEAVNSHGVAASLKWPNDVLVGRRKMAGILTEMSTHGQMLEHVVLGIGVNVDIEAFPPQLGAIATSLRIETGASISASDFLVTLLPTLETWLDRFFAGGIGAIAEPWTQRVELGARVRVITGTEVVEGLQLGLDDEGGLRVRTDDGSIRRVVAGDVELLR